MKTLIKFMWNCLLGLNVYVTFKDNILFKKCLLIILKKSEKVLQFLIDNFK